MRLFTAITFDAPSKDRLSRHMAALKKAGAAGNFTRHDNLHLTLAFIGETDRVEDAKAALDACAAGHRALTLHVEGTGRFGNILWAGASGEGLTALGEDMAACLRSRGFDIEKRPFKAHITLARKYKDGAGMPMLRPFDYGAGHISLMESTREKGVLVYREIYRKALCGVGTPSGRPQRV